MTCWSMNSSSDQPSTVSPDAFEADAWWRHATRHRHSPRRGRRPRQLARLRPLVDAEDVDGDEDRQQRGPGDPAAEHVDRVVRAEVEACGADRADEHDRDDIGAHALPNVVCQAGDAEGGQSIEDGGAQRMPGREVGDVVETDAVHVEDRIDEGREADRLGRREVLQRPLHREAERAEGQEEGEVAAATRERQQPERGEGERHEPAAAERADADDQRVEQRDDGPRSRWRPARRSSASPTLRAAWSRR